MLHPRMPTAIKTCHREGGEPGAISMDPKKLGISHQIAIKTAIDFLRPALIQKQQAKAAIYEQSEIPLL